MDFPQELDPGLDRPAEHACLMAPDTVGGDFCPRVGLPTRSLHPRLQPGCTPLRGLRQA